MKTSQASNIRLTAAEVAAAVGLQRVEVGKAAGLDARAEGVGEAAARQRPGAGLRPEHPIGAVDQLAQLPRGVEVAEAGREGAVALIDGAGRARRIPR